MALVAEHVFTSEPKSRTEELNDEPADSSSPTRSFVHHLVKVDKAQCKGYGLFATGTIQEGEVVAWESAEMYQGHGDNRPGKKLMTWQQIEERWPDKRERDHFVAYSYQVGEDLFLIPLREDDLVITTYQNHSCDPNTWWGDDYTLLARRTILPGEEVTFDYSTSESLENPEMPECYCGSPICRKKLEPLDYLNPDLIERYGNHFVSYLLNRQLTHYGGVLPTTPLSSPHSIRKGDQSLSSQEQAYISAAIESENCKDDEEAVLDDFKINGRKS